MIVYLIPLFLANILGVRTAVIGLIDGIAETTASLLKIYSGALSDRLGNRKWLAVIGYGLSTVSKPFLYFANSWGWVLGVRFGDRAGKGIRTAPRDALVAGSTDPKMRGLAFGLHRAGDTAGAFIGIGIAALIIWRTQTNASLLSLETFRLAVLVSIVPAVLAVVVLALGAKEVAVAGQRSEKLRLNFKGMDAALQIFPAGGRPVYAGQLIRFVHHPARPGTRSVCLADHVHVDDLYRHLHSVIRPAGGALG